jgi:prepilin peptidase CpaA
MAILPEAWAGTWAGVWALGIAALVPILIFSLGFLHIVRRQKSQLPIPYGVAISAAGLWVLGQQALSAAHLAG